MSSNAKTSAVKKMAIRPIEVAERLGVSESTVRNWINAGLLPRVRGTGGAVLVSVAALEAWLASQS